MKTLTLFVPITAAVLVLSACKTEQAAPLTSGIEGQVLIGPMCPVVQEGTPCPDQPYQATIVVRSADQSEEVTTFTTDPEGRFRVGLPPGEYYIDPQPPQSGGPPTPIPQTVTVPENEFVQTTIEYDSGIR